LKELHLVRWYVAFKIFTTEGTEEEESAPFIGTKPKGAAPGAQSCQLSVSSFQ
jgi:hypothetical protein